MEKLFRDGAPIAIPAYRDRGERINLLSFEIWFKEKTGKLTAIGRYYMETGGTPTDPL